MPRYRLPAAALLGGLVWGATFLALDGYRVSYDEGWLEKGIVVSGLIEESSPATASLKLRLGEVQRSDGAMLPGKIDLYLYKEKDDRLKPGVQISATVKLHPPSNRLNPGAFDYRAYCFDRHIALVGSGKKVRVISDEGTWLQRARERVADSLPQREGGGVVMALLLAERSDISTEVQDAFAASGAAHLLAISGLHVGMVAGWVFLVVWWILTRREAWIVALPVRKVALMCGVVLALLYATVAGWPVSAQRSVVMLGGAVLAWWLRSRSEPLNTMLAALILLLLIDPAAVASISLWLSFVAVAALLLWLESGMAASGGGRLRRWLVGLFWTSLVATLATLPIVVDLFGRVPTYSMVANLLLVPLFSLVVLPLSLLGELMAIAGFGSMATTLFDTASTVVKGGNDLLLMLQQWPGGNLWVGDVPLWLGILYAIGMGLSLHFLMGGERRQALFAMGATLSVYLLLAIPEHFPSNPALTVWDVGQGAASSLLLPNGEVLVVDVPGRFGSRYNGGSDMAAGLRSMGVVHVDVLVLSHAQSDHAGGAGRLIANLRYIDELWLADVPANREYEPMLHAAEAVIEKGGLVRWLKQGELIDWGGMAVEVLWPPSEYRPANGNNASLVLSLKLPGGQRILLPADIESEVEKELAGRLRHHDLALLPHHGSRTSSSEEWVKGVSPKIAIAQSGRGNRYGFPAAEVTERYRLLGSQLFDSKYGAVFIHFDDNYGMTAGQFRPGQTSKRDTALQWLLRSL